MGKEKVFEGATYENKRQSFVAGNTSKEGAQEQHTEHSERVNLVSKDTKIEKKDVLDQGETGERLEAEADDVENIDTMDLMQLKEKVRLLAAQLREKNLLIDGLRTNDTEPVDICVQCEAIEDDGHVSELATCKSKKKSRAPRFFRSISLPTSMSKKTDEQAGGCASCCQ